jgi:hypothetical protein
MVLEKLFFSPLNQLTRPVAREYFIIQCRRENYKSFIMNLYGEEIQYPDDDRDGP